MCDKYLFKVPLKSIEITNKVRNKKKKKNEQMYGRNFGNRQDSFLYRTPGRNANIITPHLKRILPMQF